MPTEYFNRHLQESFDLWLTDLSSASKNLAPLIVLLGEEPRDELFLRAIAVRVVERVMTGTVDQLDRNALLDAILVKQRWQACLAVGGAPHALAVLVLRQFRSMDRSSAGEDRMARVTDLAKEWTGVAILDPWRSPERCEETICGALFGDWWWDLRRPDEGDFAVSYIVAHERPPFCSGRLFGEWPDLASSPLPTLHSEPD